MEFLLIGSGWRADFFIRLAEKLPHRFSISAIVTTNKDMQKNYTERGFYCTGTIREGMVCGQPEFAVICVRKPAAHKAALEVMACGLPVLSETPAAAGREDLLEFFSTMPPGARFQVAEQYHLRPDHAARLSCIEQGMIGEPVQALISLTNNYHAVSLMRKYLRAGDVKTQIRAQRFEVPGRPGFTRDGAVSQPAVKMYRQTLATFTFDDKVGIYNFEDDQHRSYIRSHHIQIKGDNGEINNQEVRYLKQGTPVYSPLIRMNKGENENMEGSGLKGILFEGQWLYQNPYPEAALSDDEVAVARCLDTMSEYCDGGAEFYGFAEAAEDYYLTLLLEEAVLTGETVIAEKQPWADLLDKKR